MSMYHKAFVFEWIVFETDLKPILERAINSQNPDGLCEFIDANLEFIKDPYEGEPVDSDWRDQLEAGDLQEIADFALTAYYDPDGDFGLYHDWLDIDENASEEERQAILGFSIEGFDPGRMGSYFQDPEKLKTSRGVLNRSKDPRLKNFASRMQQACSGLYVTF